ncbi:MAG: amidohydrolase family protein [Candidatus Cyclobacteriaceae bacterium M2_1C_046]
MKFTIAALFSVILLQTVTGNVYAQIAVKGETVYTVSGDPITDGVVLIKDGKIQEIGTADRITIPENYKVYSAKVVTPGLVDARTVVGLAGIYNEPNDQDQLEKSSPLQPELRAIDAYNAREELVAFLRSMGVTTVHAGHGPGALISGQTLIAKTTGNTVEEAVIKPFNMVSFTLGPTVSRNYQVPGTRSKGVAMLREQLYKAQEYAVKMKSEDETKRPTRDLKLEVLAQVLNGEVPALITAQQSTEIMTAIRLQEEFGFKLILDGASEAYLVMDEIKKAGVPVILHPTMVRNYGDTRNATFETAAKLQQAGIPFALQSGFEGYVPKTRVVLYEAAIAAANGLGFDNALKAITIDAANIIGVGDRVGSLEKGKDADLVLFDGDPFEYTSHVTTVIINGEVVSEEKR